MSDLTKNSPIPLNPDLQYLGTESAFAFGAEVMAVEESGRFPRVYKFHIGDTGPKTPQPIIEVAIQALKDKQTKYGHFLGYPSVRENIARHLTRARGVEIKTANIMIQPGCKPVIELAMQAVLGPGDYVVGQNPGYPIYESLAKFYAKGRYIPWLARYDEKEERLEFKVEDLKNILNDRKIKLLVLNTPQNPTGMILPQEKLEAVAELARKHKFMVLFDDIYDQIVFAGRKHFSLLSVPGMLDYTINLNGFSKNFAMTGWRLGYIVAPAWLIEIFGVLAINKWGCVNRVNQIVAGAIFGDVEVDGFKYSSIAEEIKPIVRADVAEYERKGNFLVEALSLLRPFVAPNPVEGAFYDFPRVRKLLELSYVKNILRIDDEKNFCRWLLYEKGFACLPGGDFGEGGRGHIRLSYSEDRNIHIIPGVKHFMKIVIDLIEKSAQAASLRADIVDAKVKEIGEKYFR